MLFVYFQGVWVVSAYFSLMAYLFTSESVSEGHPDKVADQISDAVLDAYLAEDAESHVAVETLVTTNTVVLAGEVRSEAEVDHDAIVRDVIREIGYTDPDPKLGFAADTVKISCHLDEQSKDISRGVDAGENKEQGAGDQGMMFGYACTEYEPSKLLNGSSAYMPLPLTYAHGLVRELARIRKNEAIMSYLRPDAKSQVTVEYDATGRNPQRVDTVVISTQHNPDASQKQICRDIRHHLLRRVIDREHMDAGFKLIVNPAGRFVTGGPKADAGLTGRKIIVDTYGGRGAHGGGAFSGKDPSKVDRSAAYAARYVAKNIVAAGLADHVELQIAYAIGCEKPVSVFLDSSGSSQYGLSDEQLKKIMLEVFDLRPAKIIDRLKLKRPIYQKTATYGHFGRTDVPWEELDAVAELQRHARVFSGTAA